MQRKGMNQEEIKSLNSYYYSQDIEAVIKNVATKTRQGQIALRVNFTKHLK